MAAVYVRWYGNVLEGEVVENKRTDSLRDMVAVRIPLMGLHPVALFTPPHVYATAEQAAQGTSAVISREAPKVSSDTPEVSENTPKVSDAWMRLQQFKKDNWDTERNHLKVEALDEFYRMWRESVAEKRGYKLEPAPTVIAVDTASGTDRTGVIVVDTETGEIISDTASEVNEGVLVVVDMERVGEFLQPVTPDKPQPIEYKKPKKPIVATQLSLFD